MLRTLQSCMNDALSCLVCYVCCLPTNIFFMAAVRFRQFLKFKVYAAKEDLSYAVGKDKGVDKFCQWVLHLRDDWRGRKSLGDGIQQRDRRTVNAVTDPRYHVAEQACLNIWSVLRKRCGPRINSPTNVHRKSCKQRRFLSHMGQCSYNAISFSVQAHAVCTSLPNAL